MGILLQEIKVNVKERGHKQLGRRSALWQLLQLNVLFILGPWTTLEQTSNPYHTRVLLATYGLAYSFEVSLSIAFWLLGISVSVKRVAASSFLSELEQTENSHHFRTMGKEVVGWGFQGRQGYFPQGFMRDGWSFGM